MCLLVFPPTHVQVPSETRRGRPGVPGARDGGRCELLDMGAGLDSSTLREQQVLLTAAPSL